MISGFAIGAGFSVIENIIYLTRFPDLAPSVWMVRGLGTAVMHGTTVAVLAATAHEFAERETREAAVRVSISTPCGSSPASSSPVAIHTAFNQFPDQPMLAMIATLADRAVRDHGACSASARSRRSSGCREERAVHRAALDAWRSGGFPDDESGQQDRGAGRPLGPRDRAGASANIASR